MSVATLTGKSRIAGVFGWPVDHSRSPRLHGYWLRQFGIDGAYIPFATHPGKLEQAIRALPALGFRGGNITLPHKERALAIVDEPTPLARRIGAVNTLIVRDDGAILGDNTDGFGFIANLRQFQPDWRGAAGPVAVLGAGGAARAIVVALLDEGVPEIRLVNRTTRRAEEIAQAVGGPITVLPWEARAGALKDAALLVNSTNLGQAGQAPLDLDLGALPLSAIVYDIVYVPLMTDLLRAAQRRGNRIVDGIGMLLHQARPGFKAWFGPDPQVTPELRAFVLEQ
ncbi:MAG: shikimate dehydrogenase [Dongiaceae bacterium]